MLLKAREVVDDGGRGGGDLGWKMAAAAMVRCRARGLDVVVPTLRLIGGACSV
jgi:hypothetical protein